MALSPDFSDLLAAFAEADVRYLVVGGYAVAHHARPRFTKDLDLWLDASTENLGRARAALARFGAPSAVLDALDAAAPEDVIWMGAPPVRIDLLKGIPGDLRFDDAFRRRTSARWNDVQVWVISRDDLIAAKRASGRPQDLLDVEALERG